MKRLVTYVTGTLALLLVATATITAIHYAVMHNAETLTNLATSTLQGIGVAIGGCLGSALILRFKAARRFVREFVEEVNPNFDGRIDRAIQSLGAKQCRCKPKSDGGELDSTR